MVTKTLKTMEPQVVFPPLATFSFDPTKSHCGIPYFYPRKQPGFYPLEFPKSLDENGILEDVKKLLQNINDSFKKYALPACPLYLLFLIPLVALMIFASVPRSVLTSEGKTSEDKTFEDKTSKDKTPFSHLSRNYIPLIIIVICIGVSCFLHHKRRSGIKKAINEFNQTLMDKNIWAQWKLSNPNLVDENDDGESQYEDYFTSNTCISMMCKGGKSRRSRRPMRIVLIIKKKGHALPRGFENYAATKNYTVPVPQLPYQVV